MRDLIEPVAVIFSVLSTFFLLYREMKAIEGRMDKQHEAQSQRSDNLYEALMQESKAQSQRSDRLYEMFIDILKVRK